ncbi:MAG: type VI secretion system tube protein Hcp [Gammaproteobacteria bacterium]|nr:type VI secretion system tube protein Hcp [Gammaproteobacteria bacterium]
MAEGSTDVIMYLKMQSGLLPAEGQSSIDSSDDMVKDFEPGYFFHVREFSFDMGIDDSDPTEEATGKAVTPASSHGGTGLQGMLVARRREMEQRQRETATRGRFHGWKRASEDEKEHIPPYPLRMGEFSIVRVFDRASPVLLDRCCNSDTFTKGVLVKRKPIGDAKLHGFLRMDFDEILITHIEWKNTDPMTEDLKFLFRKIQIQYRVTVMDERTGLVYLARREPVKWEYEMELKKGG